MVDKLNRSSAKISTIAIASIFIMYYQLRDDYDNFIRNLQQYTGSELISAINHDVLPLIRIPKHANIIRYVSMYDHMSTRSISGMVANGPLFYRIYIPSIAILAGVVLMMNELLQHVIKPSHTNYDKSHIYIASMSSIMLIFVMAISLNESMFSHSVYASVFFIFLYLYMVSSIFQTYHHRHQFKTSKQFFIVFGCQIFLLLLSILLLILMLFSITNVHTWLYTPGWAFAEFELWVVLNMFLIVFLNTLRFYQLGPIYLNH